MINWFRKAGRAREATVFPPGNVDYHSHLLPGLDDGAADADTALELMALLVGVGIRHFVLTPHVMEGMWPNTPERIQNRLAEFRPLVRERFGDTVTIEAAAEYMIDEGFLRMLGDQKLLTVRDNVVLVELSYMAPPLHLFAALARLQVAGYQPLLAHPERYFFYHNEADAFHDLKNAGCLFQLNLLSLSNYYGKDVRLCAEKLLKLGLYDATGTDLHHDRHAQQLTKMVSTGAFGGQVQKLMEGQVYDHGPA